MTDTIAILAYEAYRKEARFRALVDSTVARVMEEHGAVDPEMADQEAHRIATNVAAKLLQTIYEEDAELRVWKELAERYRKMAADAISASPLAVGIFPAGQND